MKRRVQTRVGTISPLPPYFRLSAAAACARQSARLKVDAGLLEALLRRVLTDLDTERTRDTD
jgi:hypothetical protein